MAARKKRLVREVLPFGYGMLGWKVMVHLPDGKVYMESWSMMKDDAVRDAVEAANYFLKSVKEKSELRIKSMFGKIQDTRTYGEDPRKTKG